MSSIIQEYDIDDLKDFRTSDDLCKEVGRNLVKWYPNRRWFVQASTKNGYIIIKNADINMEYGYVIHIPATLPELLTKAKKAAGEVLERFNLTRGYTDNLDAVVLPKDAKGNVVNSKKGEIDTSVKSNIVLE